MNRAGNGGGSQTVVLQIGEQEFGRLVYRLNNQQSQRIGISEVKNLSLFKHFRQQPSCCTDGAYYFVDRTEYVHLSLVSVP